MKGKKYEVKRAGEWICTSKASETPKGWLEYQLRDGTFGLAQPKNWRVKL